MVNAKSDLLNGIALLVFVTYLVLVALILAQSSSSGVLVGGFFFGIGALVGLMSAVQQERSVTSVVNDYGLSQARMFATLVMSGLAAVAGVGLLAILGVQVLGQQLAGLASGARMGGGSPDWNLVFGWGNGYGIAAALAFGFAPSRLFDLFRTEQAEAAEQIAKSQPTTAALTQ
jgi:hypothetical protein